MADILYGVKLVVLNELDPVTQAIKVGGISCFLDTAEEAEITPVISEGKEEVLRTDSKILAIASTNDLLYGYDLKLKDNTFDLTAAALIEGAVINYDDVEPTKVIGYSTPKLADGATMKPFSADIYVANYNGDSIVNYAKITLNKCEGKAPKMSLKKEFFAPEFEIKAREATKANLAIKDVTYVDALPTKPVTP